MALHHKIKHHLAKFHKLRKKKEENLPLWKENWNTFNEKRLGWLETLVDKLIPWLVLILLFIIIGEFSHELNIFQWKWMEAMATWVDANQNIIATIDDIVVGFFITDLYFNFFKKATFLSFLKTSFVDIIAVAPLGLIFSAELGQAQSILHVSEDIGKEAKSMINGGEEAATIMKLEKLSIKTTQAVSRAPKIIKAMARLPRLLRLNRLSEFFGNKTTR